MKIVECPRDAMQGIKTYIPSETKITYINQLLKVGFNTLDMGSFVSPKAIPQMKDTNFVLDNIDYNKDSGTKLLVIVANERGAIDACKYDQITYLGYPFSISPTFQKRNTNAGIEESFQRVKSIYNHCIQSGKELVIYISMAFGNPYGDPWNHDIAIEWIRKISDLGVKTFSMADTVGVASPDSIYYLFSKTIPEFSALEIGAHLHTTKENWKEKVEAAIKGGCKIFDSAIKGLGGCPMAKDDLVGNLATEDLLSLLPEDQSPKEINQNEFKKAMEMALDIFPAF